MTGGIGSRWGTRSESISWSPAGPNLCRTSPCPDACLTRHGRRTIERRPSNPPPSTCCRSHAGACRLSGRRGTSMSITVFDTLAYAKKPKAAGVPDAQAEAQAEALASAIGAELATKTDLNEATLKLEGKITLVHWMVGFNIALTVTLLLRVF